MVSFVLYLYIIFINKKTSMSKTTFGKLILIFFLSVFYNVSDSFGCHAIALVNPMQQSVAGGIQVTASSDSPTCGCAVYWLDIEVRYNSNCDPFTGGPLQPGIWVPYNTYPFFQSQQMQKPNCVVQQYPWVVIPFTGLCPGVSYKYRMRENHNGQAGPWTTTFTFTVPGTPSPLTVTSAASTTNICQGQSSQLSSTISGGCSSNTNITWSPATGLNNSTIANPVATPTVTTTYTVTYQDVCSSQSVTSSVTINVTPAAVAGSATIAPTSICAGQTTTLTLTGSTGAIQWQSAPGPTGPWTNVAGATTTPYTTGPLTATTYFRAVVTGGCGTAVSNSVAVAVSPAPNLVVTPPSSTICPGGTVTFTASGANSYSWNTTPATTGNTLTLTPASTTTYTVTGFGVSCSTQVAVTVTVAPLPVANAGPDVSICTGSSTTLSGSGGVSCAWTPANMVITPNNCSTITAPAATQTYTLTVTNAQGCTATDQVTVSVNPLPPVSAGPDASICVGSSATLNASGAANYTWSPATDLSCTNCASPVASPLTTTTYVVTGVDANGCMSTDTVVVAVNQIPVANAGPDAIVCNNGSTTLNASGGGTFTWFPNNGSLSCTNCASPVATPTATTTYTVMVANGSCTDTDSLTVTMSSSMTTTVTTTPPTCNGACNGQAVVNVQGGQPGYSYSWSSNPSQTTTATGLCAGTYSVTVTDLNGCTATDSAVIVNPPLVVVIPMATPSTICYGQSSTLTAGGIGGTGSGYTYTWGPSSSTTLSCFSCASPVASPLTTTTYNVIATDANGCQSASQPVTVTVNPQLGLNMSGTASICAGNTTPIGVAATGGNGGPYNYAWAPSSTLSCSNCPNPNATPAVTTTYTVTVTDNCGSPAITGTVTVSVLPPLTVSFSADQVAGCAPLTVNFTDNTSPQSVSWNWNLGGGNMSTSTTTSTPSNTYTAPGTYDVSLSVIDVNGCPGSYTAYGLITVYPDPVAGFDFGPQPTTTLAPEITFTPDCQLCASCVYYINNDSDAVITNNCTGFTYSFPDTGTYVVTQEVYTQYGCMATITHTVRIEPAFVLYAPNAFTPNGDGLNEVFLPQGIGIDPENYELFIFDRWGNLLFKTQDMHEGWDGCVWTNKKLVQEDTYIWKVVVKDIMDVKHIYNGHVSVIK